MSSVNIGASYIDQDGKVVVLKGVRINCFGKSRYTLQSVEGQLESEIGDKELREEYTLKGYSNAQ